MKEEITKVLTMVQEGKLSAEEASGLIQALKEKDSTTATTKGSDYMDRMLKVRVISEEGDNVSVNLPLRLIKVALKSGLNIASAIPESAKYVKDINILDVDLILKAIEDELSGPIVDVESQNGDKVSVVIE
ncbi:hypothetical protein DVB69_01380 [Sporosarcina sp. BI001-red]|uniref:SHOCT-like domain-containing protein n=1 Tax=Sporosarcina sp. BI001-red TaxID=2282866 RepID=UPI000E23908C|nr:hypothetical protein [Sporosarcina sp. BI001-red]REB11035.1 hypothetical protein DVB69_01380 [Sporosarcina sp. BI001-red]